MNEIINKYIKLFKKPKSLIIMGITGILLILISSCSSFDKNEKTVTNDGLTAQSYKSYLEEDIKKTVISITGSKKVSVVITLESSVKYSYADIREETISEKKDKDNAISDNELKSGYITVKTAEGGEQALLITEEMPKVRGVAIVCDGGDNEYIAEKIQNAVMAALDITSKRVYICGRNT